MSLDDRPKKSDWPAMWWWGALAVILICAGILRYTGYNFSLPYVEHLDEPSWTTAADSILHIGTAAPIHRLDAYPPGIVTLDYFLLRWFHNPAERPTTILPIVRLLSITSTLGIAAVIALLGNRATARPLAGLLAAGLWGVGTTIVELSRYGTADNFVAFFAVLSLLLTLLGTRYSRSRWLTLGVISLILAVMFKYQAIFFAPVVFLIPLWRIRSARREERRAILLNYADNVIIFAVFLFWLIMLTPALDSRQMVGWDQAYVQQLGFPSPQRIYGTLQILLSGYAPVVTIPGLLGLGFYLSPRARQGVPLVDFGAVLVSAILWIVGISSFGVQGMRHSMAAVALLAALIGIGLSGYVAAFQWVLSKIGGTGLLVNRAWVGEVVVGGLVLLGSFPQIQGSIANAYEHTLHDRRNDLAAWAENTLDPGLYIADRDNHKTFEPFWGGFQGKKYFPLFAMELVTQRPLEEWRNNDVLYAIVPYDTYQQMQTSADGQSYLDQMVLLKSYPPDPRYRGPSMVVFRLYSIQHQVAGSLGPIKLLGYDIDRTEVAPGESFTIRYYWQASQPTDVPYMVFNHLDPLDSFELVAQSDGPPLGESRPTTSWDDSSETILSQPFTITVGENVPPDTYRLIVGFYRLDTGQRLTTPGGDSFLLVTTIQVKGK